MDAADDLIIPEEVLLRLSEITARCRNTPWTSPAHEAWRTYRLALRDCFGVAGDEIDSELNAYEQRIHEHHEEHQR